MFGWIRILFNKAFKIAKALIKAAFTSAFEILMAKLQDIAQESIIKLASSNLGNAEKRSQAFQEVKAKAIEKLLSFNDRDIDLIVQTTYNALRNEGVIK